MEEIICVIENNHKHYYSNSEKRKSFQDDTIVVFDPANDNDDRRAIERLTAYAFACSFDATNDDGFHADDEGSPRSKGEQFNNIFEGKLGELAVYKVFKRYGIEIDFPNLEDHGGLHNYDSFDLKIGGKYISVKTTFDSHQFLLLKTAHYNEDGEYRPNINRSGKAAVYDYQVLARYRFQNDDLKKYINEKHIFGRYTNQLNGDVRDMLLQKFLETKWEVGVSGYITIETFRNDIIAKNHIVKKEAVDSYFGRYENDKSKVRNSNYYCQAFELEDFTDKALERIKSYSDRYLSQMKQSDVIIRKDIWEQIELFPESVSVSKIVERINSLVEANKLKVVTVNDLLEREGYLQTRNIGGKRQKFVSDKGKLIGISQVLAESQDGEQYYKVVYDQQGQKFVLNLIHKYIYGEEI